MPWFLRPKSRLPVPSIMNLTQRLSLVSCQNSEFVQTMSSPRIVNFTLGQPGKTLIPKDMIDSSLVAVTKNNTDPFLYQYSSTIGTEPFRRELSCFLERKLAIKVDIQNLAPSFGNSLALSGIVRTLAKPGDTVVVEEFTYFLAGSIFEDVGCKIKSLSIDADGLCVDILEHWIRNEGGRPRLVYTIPYHHNPTSVCLSDARRSKLLSLAVEFNFIVVSDEPYTLLSFNQPAADGHDIPTQAPLAYFRSTGDASIDGSAPPSVHSHVVTMGSFSKILAPGLRLGWLHAAAPILTALRNEGAIASGGGPPSVLLEAARHLMSTRALDGHVNTLCAELGARADLLAGLVGRLESAGLGLSAVCRRPTGGYFMWVEFTAAPAAFDAAALWDLAQQGRHGVSFLPGSRTRIGSPIIAPAAALGAAGAYAPAAAESEAGLGDGAGRGRRHVRLSFAFYTSEEISEGWARFEELLRDYLEALPPPGGGA